MEPRLRNQASSPREKLEGWNIKDSDSDTDLRALRTSQPSSIAKRQSIVKKPDKTSTCVQASSDTRKIPILSSCLMQLIKKNKKGIKSTPNRMQGKPSAIKQPVLRPVKKRTITLKPIINESTELELMPKADVTVSLTKPYNLSFDFTSIKEIKHIRAKRGARIQHKRIQSFCQCQKETLHSKELKLNICLKQNISYINSLKASGNFPKLKADCNTSGFKEFVFPSFHQIKKMRNTKHLRVKSVSSSNEKVHVKDYFRQIAEFSNDSIWDVDEDSCALHKHEWKSSLNPYHALKDIATYYDISEELALALVVKYYMFSCEECEPVKIYSKIRSNDDYFMGVWCIIKKEDVNFDEKVRPLMRGFLKHKKTEQMDAIFCSIKNSINCIGLNEFIELVLALKYKRMPTYALVEFIQRIFDPQQTYMVTKYELIQKLRLFLAGNKDANSVLVQIYTEIEDCFREGAYKQTTLVDMKILKRILMRNCSLRERLYSIMVIE